MTSSGLSSATPVHTVDFGGLTIAWDSRVLSPRQWTVQQSLWAADLMTTAPAGRVLELCAGAGQIGLRAVTDSARELVSVEADPVAVSYLRHNASEAGLADRVEVRHGFMETVMAAGERFALVIADPPWVRRTATEEFPQDPLLAIDGGEDGLEVARTCLRIIAAHLAPGGAALLQLGSQAQAGQVARECRTGPIVPDVVRAYDGGVVLRLDRPRRAPR